MIKLVLFFSFVANSAYAASQNSNGYIEYTAKAFGSLMIIVAIMLLALYISKKLNLSNRFKSSKMKVVDRLFLDSKHYIAIVEIEDKIFILGVGESVNLISKEDIKAE